MKSYKYQKEDRNFYLSLVVSAENHEDAILIKILAITFFDGNAFIPQ